MGEKVTRKQRHIERTFALVWGWSSRCVGCFQRGSTLLRTVGKNPLPGRARQTLAGAGGFMLSSRKNRWERGTGHGTQAAAGTGAGAEALPDAAPVHGNFADDHLGTGGLPPGPDPGEPGDGGDARGPGDRLGRLCQPGALAGRGEDCLRRTGGGGTWPARPGTGVLGVFPGGAAGPAGAGPTSAGGVPVPGGLAGRPRPTGSGGSGGPDPGRGAGGPTGGGGCRPAVPGPGGGGGSERRGEPGPPAEAAAGRPSGGPGHL